jgi:hypothetical protein
MPVTTPKQRISKLMSGNANFGKEVYVDTYSFKILKEGKNVPKNSHGELKADKKK